MAKPENVPDGPRPWYHVGPVLNLVADEDGDGDGGDSTSADVYLFDVIGGWWGLTADDFVRDVASLDVDQIVLHLNTPGGEVSEGVAIANMLRQHKATVRVMVDGMAASSGSVVAMAGDEIVMGIGSQMMVHKPKTWAVGDDEEMTKVAKMLKSTGDAIASTYAARAGGTVADWHAVMASETWYTAEEAVEAGLADRVAGDNDKASASGKQVTPGARTSFWDMWDSLSSPDRLDLSPFNYRGRDQAPDPTVPARRSKPSLARAHKSLAKAADQVAVARLIHNAAPKTPAADPARGPSTNKEGAAEMQFTDEERTSLRARFALAADADDDTIKAALMAAQPAPSNGPPADPPSPSKPVSVAPPGMRLVSDSVWQEREERMKKLEAHVAKQVRDERDSVITAAVKDGKFTVAQKDHFAKLWDSDPEGTRGLIDSLQKGAMPTSELGYTSGDADEEQAELAQFDNLFPPHMRASAKAGR